ncbi:MAG: hypothetical protein QW478_02895 [Candidatus Micrarchaeaceae archaeon]
MEMKKILLTNEEKNINTPIKIIIVKHKYFLFKKLKYVYILAMMKILIGENPEKYAVLFYLFAERFDDFLFFIFKLFFTFFFQKSYSL